MVHKEQECLPNRISSSFAMWIWFCYTAVWLELTAGNELRTCSSTDEWSSLLLITWWRCSHGSGSLKGFLFRWITGVIGHTPDAWTIVLIFSLWGKWPRHIFWNARMTFSLFVKSEVYYVSGDCKNNNMPLSHRQSCGNKPDENVELAQITHQLTHTPWAVWKLM